MPKPSARWWVYVLRCADGTLYTGVTTDPARRLRQHNAGTASKYTRSRRPVELVYRERRHSRGAALSREAAVKALTRREKETLITTFLRLPPARGQHGCEGAPRSEATRVRG